MIHSFSDACPCICDEGIQQFAAQLELPEEIFDVVCEDYR